MKHEISRVDRLALRDPSNVLVILQRFLRWAAAPPERAIASAYVDVTQRCRLEIHCQPGWLTFFSPRERLSA